jgi:hypothetical protein
MDAESQSLVDEARKKLKLGARPDDQTLKRCAALLLAARSYGRWRRARANTYARGLIGTQALDYGIPFDDIVQGYEKIKRGRMALSQIQPGIMATLTRVSKLVGQMRSLSADLPLAVRDSAALNVLEVCEDHMKQLETLVVHVLASSGKLPRVAKETGPTEQESVLLAWYQEIFYSQPSTTDTRRSVLDQRWPHLCNLARTWRVSATTDYRIMSRRVMKIKKKFPSQISIGFFLNQGDKHLFSLAS